MSLGQDLEALERVYQGAEPIRQGPRCAKCGAPIVHGPVHIRPAVRPEPGEEVRWHLHLCAECAGG